MRFYSFEIVIEKEAEGEGYSAYSPNLPGCFSNGRTIEEAKRNMREAIQQHVEALLAHGEPVPRTTGWFTSRSSRSGCPDGAHAAGERP
jgi:predicted RNase H-like HicB family nuclease